MRKFSRAILTFATLAFCEVGAEAAIKAEGLPELRPPQGLLEEPLKKRAHWPWLLAAACLGACGLLLWPRKPREIFVEPPASIARRELRELRPLEPVALGRILREYIVRTHAVPGPGQTFEQLAARLEQDRRWTPSLRQRFRQLADPLEIAKFAPGATIADLEELRDQALALVEDSDALNRPPVPSPQ